MSLSSLRTLKASKKPKMFSCGNEWCNRRFATKFSKKRHQKGCGVEPMRVECENCKKTLKTAETLEKHQIVCYGLAKKIICQLCDELFCSPFSLRRHLWRFHQGEEWPTVQEEINAKVDDGNRYDENEQAFTRNQQSTEKKILNFTLQSDYQNDFHYYMDDCNNYEFLEEFEQSGCYEIRQTSDSFELEPKND